MNNARALFERVLNEDANRKSAQLWERYLAFEFEMGDLSSALTLEKRAREALGEAGSSSSAASSGRNMHLLLLRYQFGDVWPCTGDQKQYLQYIMGKGPPPAGYERRRASKADDGGDSAAAAAAGPAAGGSGGGGAAAGDGSSRRQMENGGDAGLGHNPGALLRFIEMLPEAPLLDGPLPNLDIMFDAMQLADQMDGQDAFLGGAGMKREFEGDDDNEGMGQGHGVARDMYRMRAKQRARVGSME